VPRTKSAESSHLPAVQPAAKPQEPASAPAKRYSANPEVSADLPEDQRRAGILATSAIFNAAGAMHPLQKNLVGEEATSDAILLALQDKVKALGEGDMATVESMLLSQAISLQTLYAGLVRKGTAQEYLKTYQVHMTLALKAQAQSRATLEALIELKQPRHPATFIKQANVANGPQQVNNGTPATAQPLAPAEETTSAPSKLLEANPTPTFEDLNKGANEYERLDQRTA